MKSTFILFSLVAITLTSCDHDNNPDQIESNLEKGSWRITQFIDSGDIETNDFSGYTFTFSNNGTITATNGTNTYNGTWSITESNSSDDSPYDLDFNIHFNLTNDFEDLNDDWDITASSATKIELIDVSGGNGGTDILIFERV